MKSQRASTASSGKTFGLEKGSDRDRYRIWDKISGETLDYVPAIIAPEAGRDEPGELRILTAGHARSFAPP